MAPGVAFPPPTVTTNEGGVAVTRFALRPVVTNVATATNSLAALRERLAQIEAEVKDVLARENPLKPVMNQDFRAMMDFPANYVPQDEEGRKIKARVAEMETELKGLREQLEKKMLDDPAYQELKGKVDAHKKEWQDIARSKDALKKEHNEVAGQILQLQKLMEASDKAAADKGKTAGGVPAP